MKTIERYAKKGEQCDVMKALTSLTNAYISLCGISLGCRTVVYYAALNSDYMPYMKEPSLHLSDEPFISLYNSSVVFIA